MKRFVLLLVLAALFASGYGQEVFTVMSYNIRNSWANDGENVWQKRRGATVNMIMDTRPAVVGMQELCPEQEEFLAAELGGYEHVGVGRDDGKSEGEIMAIFYDAERVKIEKWGTFWLSETPDKPSMGWDAACKRTCTWAVMTDNLSGQRFLMFNTHLDHVGKIARKMEAQQIADSVMAMSMRLKIEKVFMTGDFNTSARNEIFLPLKMVMKEAREVSPVSDKGYTYNGFGKVNPDIEQQTLDSNGNTDNEVAIDHIFFSGVEIEEFRVLRENYGAKFVSDHFPVVGVFVW